MGQWSGVGGEGGSGEGELAPDGIALSIVFLSGRRPSLVYKSL